MYNINKYLPKVLQPIIEFKLINGSLDIELNELDIGVKGIQKQSLVATADEYGISKWENSLGILPKEGDSLQIRRFRVQNTLTNKLPFTYRWLEKKLTEITGSASGWTLDIDYSDYSITIILSGLNIDIMAEVQKQLRVAIPANMELQIGTPSVSTDNIYIGIGVMYATKYLIGSNYSV